MLKSSMIRVESYLEERRADRWLVNIRKGRPNRPQSCQRSCEEGRCHLETETTRELEKQGFLWRYLSFSFVFNQAKGMNTIIRNWDGRAYPRAAAAPDTNR